MNETMSETKGRRGIRVLVIDDHPAVRQGLGLLLEAGGHVMVAEAEDRKQIRSCLDRGDVDMALLDLTLAKGSGFDLLDDLRGYDVPIVIYSMHEDPGNIERALRSGALGYVTKQEKPRVLWEAIDEVRAGRRFLSPRAARGLAEGTAGRSETAEAVRHLSEREREILTRMSRGETGREIADALSIGDRTVETYCQRIIVKLGLQNMKALRKFAIAEAHRP